MLLNATVGTPPADFVTFVLQWTSPDSTIIQVQSMLYTRLSTALLAIFLTMLGKQQLDW